MGGVEKTVGSAVGSVWVHMAAVVAQEPIKHGKTLKRYCQNAMGSAWVPSGFSVGSVRVQCGFSDVNLTKPLRGTPKMRWVPRGFRVGSAWVQ